jgi:TolB-like protein
MIVKKAMKEIPMLPLSGPRNSPLIDPRRAFFMAITAALALALLSGCATTNNGDGLSLEAAIEQSAAALAAKLPPGMRVAVVAFESPHGNISGYIMDELVEALAGGSLEVADQNNLECVYRELDFQMSGDVDDKSVQSIGKFLGARYVVTGQLVGTGGSYRYRLNAVNVETAVHESSTRLDVRDDRHFRELAAALREAAPEVLTLALAYTQYASPAYTRYASPAYTQYASPVYTQYASPAYTQYASPAYTRYASPAYTQYASISVHPVR